MRNRVTILLADSEYSKLEQLAANKGMPLGTFARSILLAALARRA